MKEVSGGNVQLKDAVNGDPHTYHARLDSGPTNSFISETGCIALEFTRRQYLSNHSSVDKVVPFHLGSPKRGDAVRLNNVLVIPDIPARHSSKEIDIRDYPHLAHLPPNNERRQTCQS